MTQTRGTIRRKANIGESAPPPAGAVERCSTDLLRGGLFRFDDRLAVETPLSATIVTCTAWLLEIYELESGDVRFLTGATEVRPPARRFAAIFPPFSMARLRLDRARGRVLGFADTAPLPEPFSLTPTLFEPPAASRATAPAQILGLATAIQPVAAWPHASALSRRAKRIVDQSYLEPVSLGQVALRLGVTAAHLSRQFKRDFHMTPASYLHQLRIADVPLKLARGGEIGAVAHDVGYRDLSRFYKQFRKATRSSPAVCRASIAPGRGPLSTAVG